MSYLDVAYANTTTIKKCYGENFVTADSRKIQKKIGQKKIGQRRHQVKENKEIKKGNIRKINISKPKIEN